MKTEKSIFKNLSLLVVVFALFLFYSFSKYRRFQVEKQLKADGVLTGAIFKRCSRTPQGGRMVIDYRIKVDNSYFEGTSVQFEQETSSVSCSKVGRLMNQGYRFAVIYSKSDPTVNMIILKESSCDYFGKPYSDSTRVLCEELGLEGCSNSGTKIDERSWWDKLLHP